MLHKRYAIKNDWVLAMVEVRLKIIHGRIDLEQPQNIPHQNHQKPINVFIFGSLDGMPNPTTT